MSNLYNYLSFIGKKSWSVIKSCKNIITDLTYILCTAIIVKVFPRVGVNEGILIMLFYLFICSLIGFFRWCCEKQKNEKIKMPKKRFTQNEGNYKILFDMANFDELLRWVNDVENELELNGYYINSSDEQPKEPIKCPICGSIDIIDNTCTHCKTHMDE